MQHNPPNCSLRNPAGCATISTSYFRRCVLAIFQGCAWKMRRLQHSSNIDNFLSMFEGLAPIGIPKLIASHCQAGEAKRSAASEITTLSVEYS
jgi:hypothetical protein